MAVQLWEVAAIQIERPPAGYIAIQRDRKRAEAARFCATNQALGQPLIRHGPMAA